MSLDGRIKAALEADAARLDPRAEARMDEVLERGPTRRRLRSTGRGLAIAAVVAAFVAGGVGAVRLVRSDEGTRPGGPRLARTVLDGQWQLELTVQDGLRAGFGYGRARQLAGPRELDLALGVVRQIRPGSFETVPVNGIFDVRGPYLIVQADGETLVLGWSISGDRLRLRLVDDSRGPAGTREDRLIWTTHPWTRIG